MVDFVRGPLVWIAMAVCIGGTFYQIIRFYRFSRRKAILNLDASTTGVRTDAVPAPSWAHRLVLLRLTAFGRYPVMVLVSTLFHLALILTPFCVLAHSILLDLAWGIQLPSLAERATDVLAGIVVLGGIYFLARRLFMRRVRAITTIGDYLVLTVAVAPYLTGILAYHQVLDYRSFMVAHMLTGEILLMAIPFTKLVHMPFFFINRFVMIHENSFGRGGSRVWR